jgi:phytoene dehydrogenase-like protein
MAASKWDAIVIGAGHNGLVAAATLARAGRRVLVLERRDRVGGACVTEELWPGFHVSRAAYVAGLLRPVVIEELGLQRHGLELLRRDPSSFTPLPDGRALLMGSDLRATHDSIAAFSPRDAARFADYERLLDRTARVIEPLLDAPAFDPAKPRWSDLGPLLSAGRAVFGLRSDLARAAALLLGPARTALESWFESEPLRSTLATDAIIGAWAAPSTPGTGYVLFHHVMGETGGARGVWAYVRGGMGALSEAIAASAREVGATIRVESSVERISVANGRVTGVVLENGDEHGADQVFSCADPNVTFNHLIAAADLPEEFRAEVNTLDFRSPVAKFNLALDGLPEFLGRGSAGQPGPEHHGTIHIGASSLDALDASFAAAERGELPEDPMIEMTIPSALDPTLAPPGKHVASLFVQHVPYAPSGGSWDVLRDGFARRVFDGIDRVAPGFSEKILHYELLAPPDLERIFGLTGGNIFHGAMSLDRLAFMRPVPGWARYRTPIDGLLLCGAGTHPGGGVMGACGRNAARLSLT